MMVEDGRCIDFGNYKGHKLQKIAASRQAHDLMTKTVPRRHESG